MDDPKLSDHDLLITLHSEMKGMRKDIQDLKMDSTDRIKSLEKAVANLQIWRGWLTGGLAVITLALTLLAAYKK